MIVYTRGHELYTRYIVVMASKCFGAFPWASILNPEFNAKVSRTWSWLAQILKQRLNRAALTKKFSTGAECYMLHNVGVATKGTFKLTGIIIPNLVVLKIWKRLNYPARKPWRSNPQMLRPGEKMLGEMRRSSIASSHRSSHTNT